LKEFDEATAFVVISNDAGLPDASAQFSQRQGRRGAAPKTILASRLLEHHDGCLARHPGWAAEDIGVEIEIANHQHALVADSLENWQQVEKFVHFVYLKRMNGIATASAAKSMSGNNRSWK
jgi:hypothetical protein